MSTIGKWFYDWATVITGVVAGFCSVGFELAGNALTALDFFGPIDLTQWGISAQTAARTTFVVAILKGVHSFYQSKVKD